MTDSIILNYVIQALSGAFTGYITNTYAINMLFKEYTPLKIGGVIKKTRTQFIQNVSELVERDIINHKTLIKEIEKDDFRKNIDLFAKTLLMESIYAESDNIRVKDIPGYSKTSDGAVELAGEIVDGNMDLLLRAVFSRVELDALLSEKQLEKLTGAVLESATQILETDGVLRDAIYAAYTEICGLSPNDIVGQSASEIFCVAASSVIARVWDSLGKRHADELKRALHSIMDSPGSDDFVEKLQRTIYEKSIREIISGQGEERLFEELVSRTRAFVNSSQGHKLALELSTRLIESAREVDKSIIDLISKDFRPKVEQYMRANLPGIVSSMIEWIQMNREDIERLIQEAVDESVESAEGMKGTILRLVRDSVLKDIAQKYGIVAKIVSYLEEKTDIDTISSEISEEIIGFIKKRSVRDIVLMLEGKGLLSGELLCSVIERNVDSYIGRIPRRYLERALSIKIGDIISTDMARVFESRIKPKIANYILEKFIFPASMGERVAGMITQKLHEIWDDSVSKSMTSEMALEFSVRADELIRRYMADEPDKIKYMMSTGIREWTRGKSLLDIVGEGGIGSIAGSASAVARSACKGAMDGIGEKRIHELADSLNSAKGMEGAVSGFVQNIVKGNLEKFVEGNIRSLVSRNLARLDDDELCGMVQEFMGKELKPITGFGALLGLIAGIMLASMEGSSIYINIPVYAVVGWITNVIALWMIFRPYRKIGFLSKIPVANLFSQGYIVKNKPKFAHSMSKFVEEELMDRQSISRSFEMQRGDMADSLIWKISAEEYEAVGAAIGRYEPEISKVMSDFARKSAITRRADISHAVCRGMFESGMNSDGARAMVSNIKESILLTSEKLEPSIARLLLAISKSRASLRHMTQGRLGEISFKTAKAGIEKMVSKGARFLSDPERTRSAVLRYSNSYRLAMGRSAIEIFGQSAIEGVKGSIQNAIDKTMHSRSTRRRIIKVVNRLFEKELSSEKTVQDVFGGAVKRFLSDNSDYMLERLTGVIKRGIASFEGTIKHQAKESVKGELGMLQKGMYIMIGGDSIIDSIVERIVNEKIPRFLDDKKGELGTIAKEIIENRIYTARPSEFGMAPDMEGIASAIDEFMERSQMVSSLGAGIGHMAAGALDSMARVPVGEYLYIIALDNLDDVYTRFGGDIEYLRMSASNLISQGKEKIASTGASVATQIVGTEAGGLTMRELLGNIPNQQLQQAIDDMSSRIAAIIPNIAAFSKLLDYAVDNMNECVQSQGLEKYISREELMDCVEGLVMGIVLDDGFGSNIRPIFDELAHRLKNDRLSFVNIHTKDYAAVIVVSCVMDALGKSLPPILRDIDFKGITRDEINKMEPAEIHRLFNSFAGSYFTSLRLYGLLGGIFGIHPGVTGAAAAAFFGQKAAERRGS